MDTQYKDPTKGEGIDKGLNMQDTESKRNPNLVYTTEGNLLTDTEGNPFQSYEPRTLGEIDDIVTEKDKFLKDISGTNTAVGGYIDPEFGKSSYDTQARTMTDLMDINEVRAREQGTVAKLAGGFGRYVATTGLGTLGNVVGTVVGLGEGIQNAVEGEGGNAWTRFWDGYINNSVNEFVHDSLDKVNEWMPNYRSQYEKDMGVFRSIFTAGFLSDQVANLGWTSSAILSTVLTGGMGGASAASGLAKVLGASKGAQSFIYRLIGGITGAMAESATESIDRYHEAKDAYSGSLRQEEQALKRQVQMEVAQRYEQDGYNPNLNKNIDYENAVFQEITNKYSDAYNQLQVKENNIESKAKAAARQTFLLNEVILSATNTIGVFSNIKAPMMNAERLAKGSITNIFREKGAKVAASKGELWAREGLEMLSQGAEEIEQKWAGETAQAYYGQEYNPKYIGQVRDWMTVAGDKFFETVEDRESWKEFAAGFITGATGAGGAKRTQVKGEDGKMHSKIGFDWVGGIWSMANDVNKTNEVSEGIYNQVNQVYNDKNLQRKLRLITGSLADKDAMLEAAQTGDKKAYMDNANNLMVRTIEAFADLGKLGDLRALVGQNDNLSDDELEKFVMANVEEETDEDGKPTGRFKSDLGLVDSNGEPLSRTEEGKKELRKRFKEQTTKVLDTIDFYGKAIDKVDSNTGYKLDRTQLARIAWGMTQAELANARINSTTEKISNAIKGYNIDYSKNNRDKAVSMLNNLTESLNEEIKRTTSLPDSEEKTKRLGELQDNLKSINDEIEQIKSLEKGDAVDLIKNFLDKPLLLAHMLNNKLSSSENGKTTYLADAVLERLDDAGLLTDDLKRDINDVIKLYRARHNYDSMVNELTENPQELTELMDREADIITDSNTKELAKNLNSELEKAGIKDLNDFKQKAPEIFKKVGITDDNFRDVFNKAAESNPTLHLYNNAILYQKKVANNIENSNVDDIVKQTALTLLNGSDLLSEQFKYMSKKDILRALVKDFDNLSEEELATLEKVASLIYVAKEEINADDSNKSDTTAAENEAAQEEAEDIEEEKSDNASDTPTPETPVNNPTNDNLLKKTLKAIYNKFYGTATFTDENLLSTYDKLVQEVGNAQLDLATGSDKEQEAAFESLISAYQSAVILAEGQPKYAKDYTDLANTIKKTLASYYANKGLVPVFPYDVVSTVDSEIKELYPDAKIIFNTEEEYPEGSSVVTEITMSNGKVTIEVTRGPNTRNVQSSTQTESSDNQQIDDVKPEQLEGDDFVPVDNDTQGETLENALLEEQPTTDETVEEKSPSETPAEETQSENEASDESSEEPNTQSTEVTETNTQTSAGENKTTTTETVNEEVPSETKENTTKHENTPNPKRPFELGKRQNGVFFSDASRYKINNSNQFEEHKEKPDLQQILDNEKVFEFVNYGGLSEFLKDNPNAPVYIKMIPEGRKDSQKVIGLYVKIGDRYQCVGYKVRALSPTVRPDFAITNNIFDAITGANPSYTNAFVKLPNGTIKETNIKCNATQNEDGYFTLTNEDGNYFTVNTIGGGKIPYKAYNRHSAVDTKVGDKSLQQAYEDGDIYVGKIYNKSKEIELQGKNGSIKMIPTVDLKGGICIAFKSPTGEWTTSGIVGRKLKSEDINRASENSIIASISELLQDVVDSLNKGDYENAAGLLRTKDLNKYLKVYNYVSTNTKDGIVFTSPQTVNGKKSIKLGKNSTLDDLVDALVQCEVTYAQPDNINEVFNEFLGLSETGVLNFEQQGKILFGFETEKLDEHNINVEGAAKTSGKLLKLGNSDVNVVIENNKITIKAVGGGVIYNYKQVASLLGLQYTPQQVNLLQPAIDTILYNALNNFKDCETFEINVDGEDVTFAYFEFGEGYKVVVNTETNQVVNLNKNRVLSDAIEQLLYEKELAKSSKTTNTETAEQASSTQENEEVREEVKETKELPHNLEEALTELRNNIGEHTVLINDKKIVRINGRPVTVIKIGDFNLPFYCSTGKGGKEAYGIPARKWYPIFGIDTSRGKAGFLNKGNENEIKTFYGSDILRQICDILNDVYGDVVDYTETAMPTVTDIDTINVTVNQNLNPVPNKVKGAAQTVRNNAAKEISHLDSYFNITDVDLTQEEESQVKLPDDDGMPTQVDLQPNNTQTAGSVNTTDDNKENVILREKRKEENTNVYRKGRGVRISPSPASVDDVDIAELFAEQQAEEESSLTQAMEEARLRAGFDVAKFFNNGTTTVKDVLTKIANENNSFSNLANNLLNQLKDFGVQIVLSEYSDEAMGSPIASTAIYDSISNKIYIKPSQIRSKYATNEILLHEILHAIVFNTKKDTNKLKALTKTFWQVRKSILKQYGVKDIEEIKSPKVRRDLYGLTNVDEFISELFVNNRFAKIVDRAEPTFLDRLLDWLFGNITKLSSIAKKQIKELLTDFSGNTISDRVSATNDYISNEVLRELRKENKSVSNTKFISSVINKVSSEGKMDDFISKVQTINSRETRDNLADFIRYTVSSYYDELTNQTKAEMDVIIANAPRNKDGKLLAPNGQFSNLSPKQWALVRTKAFKEWFGDWEKYAPKSDATEKLLSKLTDIANSDSRYSALAKLILDNKALPYNLKYFKIDNNRDDIEGHAGMWHSVVNLIEVLGNNVSEEEINKALLHELIHYNTEELLTAYKNSPESVPQNIRQNVTELYSIIDYAKKYITEHFNEKKFREIAERQNKNIGSRVFYAFDNKGSDEIDEFVSEIFTNPGLQEILNGIPYKETKQTLWDKIKECIQNIFGIPVNKGSVLDDALKASTEFITKAKKEYNSVSKVVDENGEPLVVYHTVSTDNDPSFTVFDTNKEGREAFIYTTDNLDMSKSYAYDAKNRDTGKINKKWDINRAKQQIEKDKNEIQRVNKFIDRWEKANNWSEYFGKNVDESDYRNFSTAKEDGIKAAQKEIDEYKNEIDHLKELLKHPEKMEYTKPLFVNIKRPLIIEGEGNWWNELNLHDGVEGVRQAKYMDNKSKYKKEVTNDYIVEHYGQNAYDSVYEYGIVEIDDYLTNEDYKKIEEIVNSKYPDNYTLESTRTIEDSIKENSDYDGMIVRNVLDYGGGAWLGKLDTGSVFAAKEPNQVKSATDNVGTFSRENNDILDNVDTLTDSQIVEMFYDNEFGLNNNSSMKGIREMLDLFKDPDFVLTMQKGANISNFDSIENVSKFATSIDNKNNKCN